MIADALRRPLLFAALALALLSVLVELGSIAVIGVDSELPTPGIGIPCMALLDFLLLYTIILFAAPLFISDAVQARVQGIVTLGVSLLALLGAIALLMAAILLLGLMVSLLMAVPFGTIVYMGIYGSFELAAARFTLGILMVFKLGLAACLMFAHQRFLENRGLVLLVGSSLLANVIITFLHGLVPRFLVSITDAIAGIIIVVLAAIWSILFLIYSIPAITKALRTRPSRSA